MFQDIKTYNDRCSPMIDCLWAMQVDIIRDNIIT